MLLVGCWCGVKLRLLSRRRIVAAVLVLVVDGGRAVVRLWFYLVFVAMELCLGLSSACRRRPVKVLVRVLHLWICRLGLVRVGLVWQTYAG